MNLSTGESRVNLAPDQVASLRTAGVLIEDPRRERPRYFDGRFLAHPLARWIRTGMKKARCRKSASTMTVTLAHGHSPWSDYARKTHANIMRKP